MQKIVPHLWYDKEAVEAANFYADTFGNGSKVNSTYVLKNTPSSTCDVVSFQLLGYEFMSISAGPYFKLNPSISFHVKCATADEVDALWEKLSKGGKVLMELGTYPFSKRYGWTEDKYGVSWQIIAVDDIAQLEPRIVPVMMFVGDVCGKTEEAIQYYASVFHNAKAEVLSRYGKGEEPEQEGTVRYSSITLEGQEFGAMDSAQQHKFAFNEAVSFMVNCKDQAEIDYYWEKLSADPKAEQCGWLKDKYGVSWQVIPSDLEDRLRTGSPEQVARLTEAFLKMKKFDLAELERAYSGK